MIGQSCLDSMPTSRNGGKSLSSHGLPRWSYWSRRVFLSPVLLSSDEVFCVSWYRTGLENWRKTWKTHGGVEAGAPIRFDNRCRTANNLAPMALQCVFLPARRQPRPGRVGATLERPFCSSSFFSSPRRRISSAGPSTEYLVPSMGLCK